MPEDWVIDVEERGEGGKNVSRRIRREGNVPGVIYGGEEGSIPLTLPAKELLAVLRSEKGENTLLTVRFRGSGQQCKAMIREIQTEPLKDEVLHADFVRISLTEKIEVEVPVSFEGEAEGVKIQGGLLDVLRHSVQLSCLPEEIPDSIPIDVTSLTLGHTLRVKDLEVHPGIELLTDPEEALVHIVAPAALEAEKAAEEVEAEEEGEAEPEVIAKGKGAQEEPQKEEGQKKEPKEKE